MHCGSQNTTAARRTSLQLPFELITTVLSSFSAPLLFHIITFRLPFFDGGRFPTAPALDLQKYSNVFNDTALGGGRGVGQGMMG